MHVILFRFSSILKKNLFAKNEPLLPDQYILPHAYLTYIIGRIGTR